MQFKMTMFFCLLHRTQHFKQSIRFMHESRLKEEGCLVHWWELKALSCVLNSRVEAARAAELDNSCGPMCVQQGHMCIYKFQNLWLELPIAVWQHTTSHTMCLQCWSCSQGQVISGEQKVLSQKIKTGEQEAIYKIGETVFSAVAAEVEEDCHVESVFMLLPL